MTTVTTCSCGTNETHEIARRRTADGKTVVLWSDGLITWAMGYMVRGIGAARSAYETRKNLEAGWMAMGDVDLYEAAEVSALVRAARRAVRQTSLQARDYMRRVAAGAKFRRCGRHGAVVKEVT